MMRLTCPACLAEGRPHSLTAQAAFRLVRCPACGTEYFRRDPALPGSAASEEGSEYWEAYKFSLYADAGVRQGYERRYDEVLQMAGPVAERLASVLDVGCGIGNFLAYAEARGLRAIGTDVDRDALGAAAERGLRVVEAGRVEAEVPAASLDAVSLWDVIEHMGDPEAGVRSAVSRLRPGGVVLIETPDARFPARPALLAVHRITRARLDLTPSMYYLEHKVYFSERGLRALLDRLGIDLVAVRRVPSVREKMRVQFAHDASAGSLVSRTLARTWPALERAARAFGAGNKLLAVGRRRTGAPGTAPTSAQAGRRP